MCKVYVAMTSLVLLFFAGIGTSLATDMQANFDVAGYKGTIDFRRQLNDVEVSASFSLSPPGSDVSQYDTMELWSLPALFGRKKSAVEVCSSGIGTKVRDLVTGGQSGNVSSMSTEYFHRSVVIRSSVASLPLLCGTILSTNVTSYRAKFMGPVFGSLWFRYDNTVGTFVYGDLVGISPTSATVNRKLVLYSAGSINYDASFSSRCSGLSGATVTIKTSLSIPNTTTQENTWGFMSENSMTSLADKVLALLDGNTVVACATLRSVSSKTVTSILSWEGIKGKFTFEQKSPFDETLTTVKVEGLQSRVKGYHVHKYPVAQRLNKNVAPCSATYVSGHFNPYNITVANSPNAGTGSSDQYEIGDLSGKYGTFAGKSSVTKSYMDWNLPLFGPNSIVGRSIVIHNDDATASRLMCSSIGFPSDVITAVAVFKSPAYGTMYFRQESSNREADTMIFLELASTTKTATTSHNWHVHEFTADDDAYTTEQRCSSAGAHYNPSMVSLASPYSTECSDANPFRCELGDLSGRLGGIDVATTRPTADGKFFFTDEYLPLSGPYSILGKSVTVHGPNKAAARFACANITQLHPVVAKTTGPWVGTKDGSASGSVTLTQDTEFDVTKADVSFQNLASLASGYHIHELTIKSDASSGEECSGTSVGGHYIPFDFDISQSPPATTGTNDQYEVGDLSGKHGLLDNQTSLQTMPMDTNLPLHTSLSSADRSIVIHKKADAARWKCSDLLSSVPSGSNGHIVTATVTFNNLVTGTIKIKQIVYEDAGSGLTSFELNVQPKSGGTTTPQHNWHIHIEPVTDETNCGAALGHYDPYNSISNTDYSTGCNNENPLYCEVGDLSKKQAKYDIGGGRKLFHDVDSPLHTNYTILGRSIVFHEREGGSSRYTCANIVPDDYTYTFAFPSTTAFKRYDFTMAVANSLGISRLRVIILHNLDVPVIRSGCSSVMVTIAGGKSLTQSQLNALSSGTLQGLGDYSATSSCVSKAGATVLGQRSSGVAHAASLWIMVLGVMVTKLTMKLF